MRLKLIRYALFFTSFVLAALAAPCAAAAAPIRLVMWGMSSDSNSVDVEAELAAFERMHPDIHVVTLSMGAGAMNPQKLMTAIVGEVPPDLVLQDRFTIGDWASRGAFIPLDSLVNSDTASHDPLAIRRENFVPAAWAETMYQGHVFAIPNIVDDRVLFYNRSLFRQVGLDPNRPPQTWDEMMADAKKLTVRDSTGDFERMGFVPVYKEGWLYIWSWQQDGQFMSPDGRRCTIDNPETLKALTAIVSWYDALGGVDGVNAFTSSAGSDAQDPFLTGKIAMQIESNGAISSIARYNPGLDFAVAPVPVPAERLRHEGIFRNDRTWVTWSGGGSFAIPRGSRHVRAAWQLIEWLTSPQASLIGARAQSSYQKSLGRLFVPLMPANVIASRQIFDAYLPSLPATFRNAMQVSLNLLPSTKFRPVTFVGQLLWDEQVRAVEAATRHTLTPEQALASAQRNVQAELDAVYTRDRHTLVPALPVVAALGLAALMVAAGLWRGASRWMRSRKPAARAEARAGFLFILPWVFGFLVFTFGPILASLVLSFCDYDVLHPARWAGVSNYASLLTSDRVMVLKSLGNATYLAVVGIPLGMITSLAMAMLLNTKIKGQQFYRTAFYMPSIVPVVATSVLWGYILNADPHRGLVNALWLSTITHWFGAAPPGWEAVPQWSKPGLILMGLWGAGGGMILWLAGLQSIPATLYEAASLDGAGYWTQFRHVTLPLLSPYIFFNLIMGIIGALQTFETTYVLGNTGFGGSTGPDNSLLVPVVYLFNNAFQYFKMGYASALAWLLFVLILGLTLAQLKLAPRWVHYETDSR